MMGNNVKNEISINRKKKFIVENSNILSKDIKITILSLIMMEVGKSVIMETNSKKDVDINLDILESKNIEVLNHIYNIVKKRLDTLNKPAKNSIINDIC
jgi:hypothetical protein